MKKIIFLFVVFNLFLYAGSPSLISSDKDVQKMNRFIFNKIDKVDEDTKVYIARYLDSDFGLYAYKTNYFLPFAFSNSKYPYWNDNGIEQNPPSQYKSYESEFQISLRKPLAFNLLGLNDITTFAYTQKVWWQIYADSSPFRETNYEPEIFITLPTSSKWDKLLDLKALRFGFVHESNGRAKEQSRSWNRLYVGTIWQHKTLFTNIRAWYRIPESDDDNPDIEDYMGYGDISFIYLYGKNQVGVLLRNNLDFSDNKGAVRIDWSRPLPDFKDSFWYVKFFDGYGESLIDYNRHVRKLSLGFSFSRGLF